MGGKLCGCNYNPILNSKCETSVVRNKYNFIQFCNKYQDILEDGKKQNKKIVVSKPKTVSFSLPNNQYSKSSSFLSKSNSNGSVEQINYITKKNQINKIIKSIRRYREKKEVSNFLT